MTDGVKSVESSPRPTASPEAVIEEDLSLWQRLASGGRDPGR